MYATKFVRKDKHESLIMCQSPSIAAQSIVLPNYRSLKPVLFDVIRLTADDGNRMMN